MFSSASLRGILTVSGKQDSLFPLGPVIKCLLSSRIRVHSFIRASHFGAEAERSYLFTLFYLHFEPKKVVWYVKFDYRLSFSSVYHTTLFILQNVLKYLS